MVIRWTHPHAADQPVPGNRTERRTAQTRERILDAARSLVLDGGPLGITQGQVAETADVANNTFYNHFDNVDSLLGHLVVVELVDPVSCLLERLGPEPTQRAFMEHLTAHVQVRASAEPHWAHLVSRLLLECPSSASQLTRVMERVMGSDARARMTTYAIGVALREPERLGRLFEWLSAIADAPPSEATALSNGEIELSASWQKYTTN